MPLFIPQDQNTLGMSNLGNTSGTTGTVRSQFLLAGGNNVTLSQSVSGNSATITISAAAGGGGGGTNTLGMSNLGNTSGTSGVATGTAVQFLFAGGDNITLSQSLNGASGTITISAANSAAQTVESQSLGMSNLGNTSGTSGIASGGQVRFLFAGGNNITLSQSLNGASGTITISAANAGAVPTLSIWQNFANGGTVTAALGNASLLVYPLAFDYLFPGNMSVSTMFMDFSGTVSTGAAFSRSLSLGFYTMVNSSLLSLAFSASTSWGTNAADANISASFAGFRWVTFHSSQFNNAPNFSQTAYWMAVWNRSSGGSQTFNAWCQSAIGNNAARSGFMSSGSSNNASMKWKNFAGYYSASVTTAMPNSLAASDIFADNASYISFPYIAFNNAGSRII